MSYSNRILIVGAGFAGATYARTIADFGYDTVVIDKRPHIGGNAFDRVDPNGIRIHCYGPHLFHTKNAHIADWIRQFGAFVPYTHKVRAKLADGRTVPLPINIDTMNAVFGTSFTSADEARAYLRDISRPGDDRSNAADYLNAQIGEKLTERFFRPYTRKMWKLELEDLSSAVVKRIPLRFDRADTYFDVGEIQMLPSQGYTKLFETMLDHPRIEVRLGVAFEKSMLDSASFCFNSMPIDEFFDYCLAPLPYRSIRFHHRTETRITEQDWAVTNFTDDGPLMRETAWHVMPGHRCVDTGRFTITAEEPCDYRDNDFERYYPVKTSDDRFGELYEKYRLQADRYADRMIFIGRCGTYQYLDMDQVINQSLVGAHAWAKSRRQ